jgi:hypothetical protein
MAGAHAHGQHAGRRTPGSSMMTGPLRNTRQEAFCQLMATGSTNIAAYEAAGYKPDHGAASRLSSNVRIRARITELQATAARRAVITTETLIADAQRLQDAAEADGQHNAAINALKVKAVLAGKWVAISETTVNRGDAASESLEGLNARLSQLESERDQDTTGRGPVPDPGPERPADVRFKH